MTDADMGTCGDCGEPTCAECLASGEEGLCGPCGDEWECDNCEELRAQLDALQRAAEPTRTRLERIETAARAVLREVTPDADLHWESTALAELSAALAATDV